MLLFIEIPPDGVSLASRALALYFPSLFQHLSATMKDA